ncbi:MAG: ankyrin repeat domain-containing protein, partial [Cyanobacteria bacterium]|nr:ankyrin repeat domain-containing protein [Cyanobacteriota bacterium]
IAPLVPDLLGSTMDPNLQDHNGTPLLHQLAFWGNTLWLKLALEKGANPKSLDAYGRTALHRAAWRGNIEAARILLKAGTPLNHSGPHESTANVEAAANGHNDVVNYLNEMGSDNAAWANLLIKVHYPIEDHPELIDFLPELLLKHGLGHIIPLASRVERFFDRHELQRGYHPNETELMLLLKHPDLLERDSFKIAPFTQALTSITYFIHENVPLSDAVTKSWGDIGFLSHGFRFWKYDTVGTDTLLESFGFRKLETSGEVHQTFGQGFGYEDKRLSPSQRPCFVFRRGCLMVSHPDAGTLVIRNSSKVFGRKLLKHPAYLIPKAYSLAELSVLDPQQIPEEYHVLNKAWYTPKPKEVWQGQGSHHLPFLSDLLMGLKEQYRRFKLDTEAFEGTGEDRHFIGHRSPGLVQLVNCLNAWQREGKALPDLAFVHPELPIYQPYTSLDEDLKRTDRFKMTPKHLKELTDFISNQWSPQKYPESDWIRFLHQAGVENRAELVMIDP